MVYIEAQDKKTQVRDKKKKSYKLFGSIDTRLMLVIFDWSKIAYQQM